MAFLNNLLSVLLDIALVFPLLLSAFLFYRLSSSNPFSRRLFGRKYSIKRLYTKRMEKAVCITFNGGADSKAFRDSLYECMYLYPDTKSLVFHNLGNLSLDESRFEHFKFECLNFSHIPSLNFNCSDPFRLPCTYVILPSDVTSIPLRYCRPDIKCIAIPSEHFIPAQKYITYDPNGDPIRVDSDFYIRVPENVIKDYRHNPEWSSIRLIDENDRIFHPTFYPYWKE